VTLRLASLTPSDATPLPAPRTLGSITPRLWTRPLRELTPQTSYGFAVIYFAAVVLGRPLDPWQQWLVIHLGELLPDGLPRFRKVLVVVARQNGKTWLCTVLALFWLYVERRPFVFGTSNKLDYARDSWAAAVRIALETRDLKTRTGRPRYTNGEQDLPTRDGCHYRIGAANDDGGRSKTIDRAIGDELRQQRDWTAYAALVPATNAVSNAQIVWITNMGDRSAVVLNSLRSDAIADIESGEADPSCALFEWSAVKGAHPADVDQLAAANPQAGRRMPWKTLLTEARAVSRPGADPKKLNTFLTEIMCLAVDVMDPAISPAGWIDCADRAPIDTTGRVVLALDVAPDLEHVTLCAAAPLDDGRTRVEIVAAWSGHDATGRARAEVRDWVTKIRPAVFGWIPSGAAAAIDADLRDRRKQGRYTWPPRGVQVAEIRTEIFAVAMGFAQQVAERKIAHSGQAVLDDAITVTDKLPQGPNRWAFTARAAGEHIDATYAAAAAVHLCRTLPTKRRGTGLIVAGA
jgi:phage terminase large subunit-like protein